MNDCWDIEPKDRPTFNQLVQELEKLKNDYDYEP